MLEPTTAYSADPADSAPRRNLNELFQHDGHEPRPESQAPDRFRSRPREPETATPAPATKISPSDYSHYPVLSSAARFWGPQNCEERKLP